MSPKQGAARVGIEAFRMVPGDKPSMNDVTRLFDHLIDMAPALVRQRAFLPSANWRWASPEQVRNLRGRLDDAGLKMPRWLLRDLLIAGHSLPAEAGELPEGGVGILSKLNSLEQGIALPDTLRNAVLDEASEAPIDAEVTAAMTARLLEMGEPSLACQVALSQWPQSPAALRMVRQALPAELGGLASIRVRLAGFSTTDLLADALLPAFASVGRRAEVDRADFGTVVAALLEPASEAEAMLVLLDQDGFLPADWRQDLQQSAELVDKKIQILSDAFASHAGRSGRPLFINTLPTIVAPLIGYVDPIHEAGAANIAATVNGALARLAAAFPSVHLVNSDVALAAIPPALRTEAKHWYYGRVAYSDEASRALARAFAQAWLARQRGPVKVVALDFDNTLWGGVYGDDGVGALRCGDDFPGNAFKAFQQECLRLKAQGMLLVALSKNNPDAISVFDVHPGMSLRADDFAAAAVNWEPKPGNIRQIAKELNLGLDSFLFLDDSPHEREAMRRMCPEVIVPEMPSDPALRPLWVRSLTCTWPVRLTAEDTQRSEMYAAERKSRQLRERAVSYDDYLSELKQELLIEPLTPGTLARMAQLHERTNQFNLTTRRFSEAELTTFMNDPNAMAIVGTVTDRFGSHGIVIAGVASIDGRIARIESFLMSCRVIARQLDTAFLGALIERLLDRGIERIEGRYNPTAKNAMVREFYATHGFTPQVSEGDAERCDWENGRNAVPKSSFVSVHWRQK